MTGHARRLTTLDGLRGVAAFGVLGHHSVSAVTGLNLFTQAWLAVDFFFLLSGFVIARTYEPRLRSGLRVTAYLGLRFRRFFPAILVGTILGATVACWHSPALPVLAWIPFHLLILPVATTSLLFPLNYVQWSLFFELIANAVHALFVRRLTGPMLAVVILAGLAGLIGAAATGRSLDGGVDWKTFGIGVARVSFSFFGGVAVFRLQAAGRLKAPSVPAWIPVLVLAVFLAAPVSAAYAEAYALFVTVVLWPVLLVFALHSPQPTKLRSTFEALGLISYPLYATHEPIIQVLREFVWSHSHLGILRPVAALAAIVAVLLLAYMTTRVENALRPR